MRALLSGLLFAMLTVPASAQFIDDLTCIYYRITTELRLNWTDPGTQAYTLWFSANPNTDLENNVGSPQDWVLVQQFTPTAGPRSYSPEIVGSYGIFVIASGDQVSNAVGYYVLTIRNSMDAAATSFSLPFKFWDVVAGVPTYGVESTAPSDIVGDQPAPGGPIISDRIIRQDGIQAYRDDTGGPIVWTGLLEDNADMSPGFAYWYVTMWRESDTPIVLAGEIDNSGDYGSKTIVAPDSAGGFYATPISFRESREVDIGCLGLLQQGFTGGDVITSDKLVAQDGTGGIVNYFTATSEFVGAFSTITPGTAYWLVNKHSDHTWEYTYPGPDSSDFPDCLPGR